MTKKTAKRALKASAALILALALVACTQGWPIPAVTAAALGSGALRSTQAFQPTPAASPVKSAAASATVAINIPVPTARTAPIDFMKGDLTGKSAAALEALLGKWGFAHYPRDGKWTDEDVYQLKLFELWAGLTPDGKVGPKLRSKLAMAYYDYGEAKIPRKPFPLEGRYIGINAGHQAHYNHDQEPLSPEPNSPLRAKVSAGTTGVATCIPEYKATLAIALKTRDALELLGARVLMARTVNEVDISNVTRSKRMNAAHVDAYLALHCDGSTKSTITGLHTLLPVSRGYQAGAVLTKSRKFGAILQAESIRATGAKNLGTNDRKDLSTLNWAKMPVCLVEMGYMTNAAEDRKLADPAYQQKLAKGFAAGFVRYFNEVK